jgi:hypothetical protein
MHLAPIPDIDPEYPIAAIPRNTAPDPTSPWAMAGEYTVTLAAGGKSYTQPLTLKMDPRVKATAAELAEQFDLSKKMYDARIRLEPLAKKFDALNGELAKTKERAREKPGIAEQVDALTKSLAQFSPPNARPGSPPSFGAVATLQRLFGQVQVVDAGPRPSVKAAVAVALRDGDVAAEKLRSVMAKDLPVLNQQLEAGGLEKIKAQP